MPLFYVARQSQKETKEGEKLYHLSLKKVGRAVDTQTMATEIAEKSSLTAGDVHNVVRNLLSVMRSHLLNSRSVRRAGHVYHEGQFEGTWRENGRRGESEPGDGAEMPVYAGIQASGCHRNDTRPAAGGGIPEMGRERFGWDRRRRG